MKHTRMILTALMAAALALAVLAALLRWARGKAWWPKRRTVLYALLAVCMAGSVVWQRAATRSAYEAGGRAYTVFGEGVAAGLADAMAAGVKVTFGSRDAVEAAGSLFDCVETL